MGLFGNNKNGGILNVIRCDEPEYLVWKWQPQGVPSRRENAIRWGSKLRVKEGEVAVFVYQKNEGGQMDFIEGPVDTALHTANLPILSGILGTMYGGDTPFQAEVYFINLAGNNSIPFYIPPFDVSDPRFLDFAVPVSVRGRILLNITDYKGFIKLHRMINFEWEEFASEIRASVIRCVKGAVTNAPMQASIPLLQIERSIETLSAIVEDKLRIILQSDFGVNLKRFDFESLELDKESQGYADLYEVTAQQASEITKARTQDTVERLRMGRDVEFKRQNLSAETDYFAAHRLNRQSDVAEIAAESLGELGSNSGDAASDIFNPAGMMAGMMLGGSVGANVAGMMNNFMGGVQGQMNPPTMQTPPPITTIMFYVADNGQQTGPFDISAIRAMIEEGRITRDTPVWKAGMPAWERAGNVPDILSMFSVAATPPPLQNMPPKL